MSIYGLTCNQRSTGGTGYIGGSILTGIQSAFPELEITALLRNPNDSFVANHPGVKVIKGTFDDDDIIEKAAEAADIVLHAGNTDHMPSVVAILSGMSKRKEKSLLLHLTGTASFSDVREEGWSGKFNPRVWNDIDDIDEIYNVPETVIHRDVDKLIADASNDLLKTICICPPDIYGQKKGGGTTGTYLVPEYVKAIIDLKQAFYFGNGENIRGVVHIDDVVSLFVLVLGKYLQGGEGLDYGKEASQYCTLNISNKELLMNELQGFYFAAADGVQWKRAAETITKIGHEKGWLPKEVQPASLNMDQIKGLKFKHPLFTSAFILYIWCSNSRAESARAKKLGWQPNGPSFWEALPEDCKVAAEQYHKA